MPSTPKGWAISTLVLCAIWGVMILIGSWDAENNAAYARHQNCRVAQVATCAEASK